jgi:hypothetical protein
MTSEVASIKAEIDRNRERQVDARRYRAQVAPRLTEAYDAYMRAKEHDFLALARLGDLKREEKALMRHLRKLRIAD